MKLGRNWYTVDWAALPAEDCKSDQDWLDLFGDIPILIDVLAKNQEQAKNIAISCYPGLNYCLWVTAELKGTERQFQREKEPQGEEDVNLLPY